MVHPLGLGELRNGACKSIWFCRLRESSGSGAGGKQAGPGDVSSFALCFKTSWGPRYFLRKSRQILSVAWAERRLREPPGQQRGSSVSHRVKVAPARQGAQVGGVGRAPAPTRTRRAAPGVTVHLGLGGGARLAGTPLCSSKGPPVARPEPGSQRPPAAERRALSPGT